MSDVTAIYYFRPRADTSPEQAAQAICEEETTGTWTDISTTTEYVRKLDGTVESVEPRGAGYLTRITYPAEIFEPHRRSSPVSSVRFLFPRRGGHLGYWQSRGPRFWAGTAALDFLDSAAQSA